MIPTPLHPALVHLPLGMSLLLPVIAIVFTWTLWTGRLRTRAWLVVVLLLATLLGAGLVAMNTGQREEERVEAVVPEAAIATHEALAEQFLWITGITLVVAAVVLVLRRPMAVRAGTVATVLFAFLVTGAALRVGHAGGQLVYVHNAAAAYAQGQNTGTGGKPDAAKASGQPEKVDRDDD
jgi:uncharacterized membrane protein